MLHLSVCLFLGLITGCWVNACWLVVKLEPDKPRWQRVADICFAGFLALVTMIFAVGFVFAAVFVAKDGVIDVKYGLLLNALAFACTGLIGAFLARHEMHSSGPVTNVVCWLEDQLVIRRARRS